MLLSQQHVAAGTLSPLRHATTKADGSTPRSSRHSPAHAAPRPITRPSRYHTVDRARGIAVAVAPADASTKTMQELYAAAPALRIVFVGRRYSLRTAQSNSVFDTLHRRGRRIGRGGKRMGNAAPPAASSRSNATTFYDLSVAGGERAS